MAFCISITDDHINVFTNTLCTKSCFCKACSHGEEVYNTTVMNRKDCGHLAVIYVYTADRYIILFAVICC